MVRPDNGKLKPMFQCEYKKFWEKWEVERNSWRNAWAVSRLQLVNKKEMSRVMLALKMNKVKNIKAAAATESLFACVYVCRQVLIRLFFFSPSMRTDN